MLRPVAFYDVHGPLWASISGQDPVVNKDRDGFMIITGNLCE